MTAPELPYYPITHDDGLNIVEALNDLIGTENSLSLIAEDFDETKSYDVGNYVRYSTLLYRFTTPHPAGVWNENHVTPIKVGEQLNAFNNEKINNNAVAPEFRNDVNYAVGDVVSYQGGLYRYLSPHTAGNWDRTEVVATNAISEGGGGNGGGTSVGDEITFDGDNMIITSSERSVESLESSIAIVVNGNTHPEINAGQYVYVKLHDNLGEGLYTANSYIAEGATLTSSNLDSVPGGGMNSLKSSIDSDVTSINSNLSAIDNSLAIVSDGDTHIAISSGQYVYVKNHTTLAEGLYTANSAIGANVALTTSNVTKVTTGGFNKINSSLASVTTEVNNLKKTTAANISFKSGFVNENFGSTYSICGKIVYFTFNVRINASANSTNVIATFPSGARPLRKFSQNLISNNNDGHMYVEIETNGNVALYTSSANPGIRMSSSFIAA